MTVLLHIPLCLDVPRLFPPSLLSCLSSEWVPSHWRGQAGCGCTGAGVQEWVCMNLLEETGILDWGTKEKADRRTEGQGQHPRGHQELGKKQHPRTTVGAAGAPRGAWAGDCDTQAVFPRSPGGIDVHRVSPAEMDCVPSTVSQDSISTDICQQSGKSVGLKNWSGARPFEATPWDKGTTGPGGSWR